jgi:8-amino-7-oxononanoate synthase
VKSLATELARRRAGLRYRTRQVLDSPQAIEVTIDGRQLLSFCSNDYLGLANDPRVVAAFQAAAAEWGVGSGASHLVSGHQHPHHELEEALADFTQRPRALLFSSGYMANLGLLGTLADRHAVIYEDRLNHASLIDAARLSQATVRRYRHADLAQLGALMAGATGEALIVTDGVFSMDGNIAPHAGLAALAQAREAWLIVDDAHGFGVLGEEGRGSLAASGVAPWDGLVQMGTLGKAFGVAGAFVAGSEDVIETLIQEARTYIYTTAPPAAAAAATLASLRIAREEAWRRERLRELIGRFRAGAAQLGLKLLSSSTPIQPVILGESADALRASERLRERGLLVPAIRPPTVPEGSARLRICLCATHSDQHIDRLLEALRDIAQ